MHTFFQKEAYLRKSGFHLVRYVRHGSIWSDGISRITVSRSTKHAHEFLKDVNRALAKRRGPKSEDKTMTTTARFNPLPPIDLNKSRTLDTKPQAEVKPSGGAKSGKRGWPVSLPESDRAKLHARIVELRQQGLSHAQIARQCNDDGFRSGDGSLVRNNYVQYALKASGKKKKPQERVTPPTRVRPTPPSTLPDTVMAILTDPVLSDKQKVRMIAAYAEG